MIRRILGSLIETLMLMKGIIYTLWTSKTYGKVSNFLNGNNVFLSQHNMQPSLYAPPTKN